MAISDKLVETTIINRIKCQDYNIMVQQSTVNANAVKKDYISLSFFWTVSTVKKKHNNFLNLQQSFSKSLLKPYKQN